MITTTTYTAQYGPKTSTSWSSDQSVNAVFLRMTRNHMNDCLRARGHLFLNEVLDQLGLPRTSKGATDGWLFDHGDPDSGLLVIDESDPDEDGVIELTFTTHGIIYDKIEKTP